MSVNFTCEQQNVISLLRLCPVGETQTQFFLSNFRGLESSPALGGLCFGRFSTLRLRMVEFLTVDMHIYKHMLTLLFLVIAKHVYEYVNLKLTIMTSIFIYTSHEKLNTISVSTL